MTTPQEKQQQQQQQPYLLRYCSSLPNMRESYVSGRSSITSLSNELSLPDDDNDTFITNPVMPTFSSSEFLMLEDMHGGENDHVNDHDHDIIRPHLTKEESFRELKKPHQHQNQNQQHQCTRFADRVSIHTIDTYEEVEKRWYTTGEYFFIKKDAMSTVRRMSTMSTNTTNLCDTEFSCTRGLEIVESEAIRRKKQAIADALKTVLDNNESNNNSNSNNKVEAAAAAVARKTPESIAKAYKMVTHDCVEKSIIKAEKDAQEAAQILQDIRQDGWLKYNNSNNNNNNNSNNKNRSKINRNIRNVVGRQKWKLHQINKGETTTQHNNNNNSQYQRGGNISDVIRSWWLVKVKSIR